MVSPPAFLEELTSAISDVLPGDLDPHQGELSAAMHYALSVKAKRLRPLLFLCLTDFFRHSWRDCLEVAAAIEMIHTYSLIHDDLPCMDNDDLRRGMPTVHKVFGDAIALLAGDTLLTYAFERISRCPLPPVTIVAIIRILTVSIGKEGMAGGQALDLVFRGEREQIHHIHRLKTARFIAGVFKAAAIVADLPHPTAHRLFEAGLIIGEGFQLADDLLDITGNEIEVGKKLRKDDSNQSPNAVIHLGMEQVRHDIDEAYDRTIAILQELEISHPPFLNLIEKMVYRSK
jgi:geranylgeranyl diphosphate synthase, type II